VFVEKEWNVWGEKRLGTSAAGISSMVKIPAGTRNWLFDFFGIADIFSLGGTAPAVLAEMGNRLDQLDIGLRVLDMKFVFHMAAKGFFVFTHNYLLDWSLKCWPHTGSLSDLSLA